MYKNTAVRTATPKASSTLFPGFAHQIPTKGAGEDHHEFNKCNLKR
jgi:hypothetical protein